jgi:AcrR family transcriptional regulator
MLKGSFCLYYNFPLDLLRRFIKLLTGQSLGKGGLFMGSSVETKTPPRWRRRKQARPEELVRAALDLFVEQGFAATKISDVAKRAGVSKGTIYLYFESKEDLLLAAVRDSIVPILDAADQEELDSEASAAELLELMLLRWFHEFESRGVSGVPKLVISEAANFPELGEFYIEAVVERARKLAIRIVERGIRNGEFRDIDVKHAIHVFLAPVAYAQIHRYSLAAYDTFGFNLRTYLDTHLDLFLRAIRKEPEDEARGEKA